MAPIKRKHKTLSLKEKSEIIDELNRGVSGKSLAVKYGVGASTISDIRKKSSKIKEFVVHCVAGPGKRQTLKQAEYPRMENKLHSWFVSLRDRHVPVSSEILATKAKQLYVKYYGDENFNVSRGWISNFRKRYGIRRLKICGEKLSSDTAAVEPFIQELDQQIQSLNLRPSQIYNADESALFWKLLPDSTLVSSTEATAPGRKTSKERLTFLPACNSDGSHKLKLLVIGKSKNPRAFRNTEIPVDYKATNKAWMTSAVFKQWFDRCFIPQVRKFLKNQNLPETALLLIDNAPSHCSEQELISDDGRILTKFLPPNTTAIIQPMDQNAIRLTKLFYRKSLLAEILTQKEKDVVKSLKSLNIKHAVCFLHAAWEKVPASSLEKCWKKLLKPNNGPEDDPEDLIPLSVLQQQLRPIAVEIDLVSSMLHSIGNVDISDAEAIDWIDGDAKLVEQENLITENDSPESDDDFVEITASNRVKHQDAIKSLNIILQWTTENNLPLKEIMMLQNLKETAFEKQRQQSKQMKITNFFQLLEKKEGEENVEKENEEEESQIIQEDEIIGLD